MNKKMAPTVFLEVVPFLCMFMLPLNLPRTLEILCDKIVLFVLNRTTSYVSNPIIFPKNVLKVTFQFLPF